MRIEIRSDKNLEAVLLPQHQWHPYPTADKRDAWENLPASVQQAHLLRGEEALGGTWPELSAIQFLNYYRTGDYMAYQKTNFARRHRLRDLVTAECIEGKGRFLDEIINGIWVLCEESFWGLPPNTFVQASEEDQVRYSNQQLQKIRTVLPDTTKPGVDLWAGETVGVLAWTVYLLKSRLDAVTPLICDRVVRESITRVLTPCLDRNFLWMGFLNQNVGNWNPWCNSNWLTATLILEPDETRRQCAVQKIIQSLNHFIAQYKPDGGCDEGPSYWGRASGCLFECLELLHSATSGAINIYDQPLLREMAAYIYRVHIADRYFVNFADAPGSISLSADLIYRFGQKINDNNLKTLGAWAATHREPTFETSLGRELPAVFNAENLPKSQTPPPHLRDVWLPDIQVMAAQSTDKNTDSLFLAAKGGHNREHHNHNDVGNFIVYTDGLPAIIDIGAGTYTAKNSSPQRYDIWTMHSGYHNLPTINNIRQGYGREFAAQVIDYHKDDQTARISLDITAAYPKEANLKSWIRTLELTRGEKIQLTETYKLSQQIEELTLSFMTPCTITEEPGCLNLQATPIDDNRESGALQIYYEPEKLTPKIEEITLEDPRLNTSWGHRLFRILFRIKQPPLTDTLSFQITI